MRFKDFGTSERIVMSKDLVSVYTSIPSESETIKRLEQKNKKYLDSWKVPIDIDNSETKIYTVSDSGVIVGQVILFKFQVSEEGLKSCSISYWIDKNYTNLGITTTAVELVMGHAFEKLNVNEIDATIQPENLPSVRVIEKLKYKNRGLIGDQKLIKGRWQNLTVYTVIGELKDANVPV